jgi:hypothetical protein
MTITLQLDTDDAATVERRAEPRHFTPYRVQWRSLLDASDPPQIATVHDISVDGIGMVLQSWVAPGSTLFVTLLDAHGDPGIFNLVRVKRVLHQDRRSWSVAGSFVQRVSEDDLQSVLERSASVAQQVRPAAPESPATDERKLLRLQRRSVRLTLRQGQRTGAEAGQTSTADAPRSTTATAVERHAAATRVRLPEARRRQILEQVRARIQARQSAAVSCGDNS